jgi:hypothetical protein
VTADLAGFLRARLDEDEQTARHAFGDHNDDGPEWTEVSSGALSTGYELHGIGDSAITRHMERWDPKRTLAEVDAKRRLLDYLVDLESKALDGDWWNLDTSLPLRLLALPFAAHPDYLPEWAPDA